jgi:hypothetical protein
MTFQFEFWVPTRVGPSGQLRRSAEADIEHARLPISCSRLWDLVLDRFWSTNVAKAAVAMIDAH